MQLVWHRGDLRVHDHPALSTAVADGPALGLVVLDPNILENTSARRRAWFKANVVALRKAYSSRGGTLLVRTGPPWEVVPAVAVQTSATAVHAITSYTPYGLHRDERTEAAQGIPLHWHPGNHVYEPGTVTKDDGTPYVVYSAFARRARHEPVPRPVAAPEAIPGPRVAHGGDVPEDESDIPLPPAGEEVALASFQRFLGEGLRSYHEDRDRLDGSGTSRLSPYLTIGVLSPRLAAVGAEGVGGRGAEKWTAELLWRDFMADLLYHYPHLLTEAFDRRWQALPWREDGELFEAWKQGRTGVPVVDAAMRELRASGWISNRARMVTAQFLVKYLLLPWQWGEKVFREWLLDGDAANNAGGWQWAGGLGVDAAPYFRVFNLESQGQRHDPEGKWLRRWVPESGGSPRAHESIVDLVEARRLYLEEAKAVSAAPTDVPPPHPGKRH